MLRALGPPSPGPSSLAGSGPRMEVATFPIGAQPAPPRRDARLLMEPDGAARASTDLGKVERPQAATM